jgi:hypothetical protein
MRLRFIFLLLVILTAVSACQKEERSDALYNRLERVKEGVDIWSSIHYEVIDELGLIKQEASLDDGSLLLHIYIQIQNNGQKRAEQFKADFQAALPLNYVEGSGHQGIDRGYLDRHDKYEIYTNYVFRNRVDWEEFIANSNVSVQWEEDGIKQELILRLPAKPAETILTGRTQRDEPR